MVREPTTLTLFAFSLAGLGLIGSECLTRPLRKRPAGPCSGFEPDHAVPDIWDRSGSPKSYGVPERANVLLDAGRLVNRLATRRLLPL